jgi:vacuolar-type H+-ATPase subunit H
MSDDTPVSALEMQVSALLQKVTNDKEQRCRALVAAAESQSREIVRSARTQARTDVHKAIAEERSRLEQALRQTAAQADLEARQRVQQEIQEELVHMWAQIEGVLEARWRDPPQRRSWIEAALTAAGVLLGERPWRIEHGPGWTPAERSELEESARQQRCRSVEWASDPAIRAGLRICTPGVRFDATIPGLTAHRAEVESAFLAQRAS